MYYRAISEVVMPRDVYTKPDVHATILALNENKKISYIQLVRNIASTNHRLDMVRSGELPEVSDEYGPAPFRKEHVEIQQRRFGFVAWKSMQLVPLEELLEDARVYEEGTVARSLGEADEELDAKMRAIEERDLYAA